MDTDYKYADLAEKIIREAFAVHPPATPIKVWFEDEIVGEFAAD